VDVGHAVRGGSGCNLITGVTMSRTTAAAALAVAVVLVVRVA
jgi:hypothetical protein